MKLKDLLDVLDQNVKIMVNHRKVGEPETEYCVADDLPKRFKGSVYEDLDVVYVNMEGCQILIEGAVEQ